MPKKLTFEFVQSKFKKHECELLETEYINSSTKMKYKCKCENEAYITWGHFNQGQRCMKCSGNERVTFDFVNNYFKEQNCKLLETEYINSNTKMKYICKCGNVSSISFDNFRSGYRCMKCSGNERLTYEFVNNYFKEHNCELLETEYINSYTKMKYKCKDNHITSISWDNFKQGYRCITCSGREKLTYEFVYNYFKEHNCELLDSKYINANTLMKYRCECQCISKIVFGHFQNGQRCIKCGGSEKLTLEYVKNFFKEQRCELLETEYINANSKMKYICECNNESSISWSNFKNGQRCMKCGYDKQEKNSKSFKQFTFPSGEIRNIQGYENIALDELVKKFKEHDIITKRTEMPKIIYELKGKKHRYYPDIWIKSINKIIEVKSCYTYKKELIKNINKSLATRKSHFDFECWIYTPESKNIYNKLII